jgi:TRAP-type mannitol/chloroaromatic compound transport system permease small subunit
MKIVKGFIYTIDSISEWTGKVFSFLILFIVALVVYEVVLRNLFNLSSLWAFELSIMIYGVHFMLGAAYTLKQKGHISIDIFYSRFSTKAKAILDIITYTIFFFPFIIILLKAGISFAWSSIKILEVSQSNWAPPLYPLKVIIPVTFFLLTLQGISKIAKDIIFLVKGEEI